MQVGYNHNVRHKGKLYHIQTEDSGISTAFITTLLYSGGTIIASKKTSYEDIKEKEDYISSLREIMKEQHRQMLIDLKNGVYDDPEQAKIKVLEEEKNEEDKTILDVIKAIEDRRLKEILAEAERKKEQTKEKKVRQERPIEIGTLEEFDDKMVKAKQEKLLGKKEEDSNDKTASEKGLDEVILNYLSKELGKKSVEEPEK